jgi:hypothetical protein
MITLNGVCVSMKVTKTDPVHPTTTDSETHAAFLGVHCARPIAELIANMGIKIHVQRPPLIHEDNAAVSTAIINSNKITPGVCHLAIYVRYLQEQRDKQTYSVVRRSSFVQMADIGTKCHVPCVFLRLYDMYCSVPYTQFLVVHTTS